MVEDVEQGHELATGLAVACRRRVIVAAAVGIGGGVAALLGDVLDGPIAVAVMVSRVPAQVVAVPVAAVGGEHVVEIPDGHVIVGIAVQPIFYQPGVEGPRVVGPGGRLHGRRADDHEELVLARGEVLQQVNVDPLGVGHGVVGVALGGFAPQRIAADGRRGLCRVPPQVGIGIAGLEQDDLVLAAGVGGQAGVPGVLTALGVQGRQSGPAVGAAEPRPPVADVRAVADAIRPPAVVGVGDEGVVVPQGQPQAAVAVVQPVLAAGMVDEDQLHRLGGRVGVVGGQPARRGSQGRAGGQEQGQNQSHGQGQRTYRSGESGLGFHVSTSFVAAPCCVGGRPQGSLL